jgi:hypothetical protein
MRYTGFAENFQHATDSGIFDLNDVQGTPAIDPLHDILDLDIIMGNAGNIVGGNHPDHGNLFSSATNAHLTPICFI